MRGTWKCILAAVAVLALGAAVLAVDYATRDDAGDTAYQGMGTGGEGNPIQVTADAYGRLWVNVASDGPSAAVAGGTVTFQVPVAIAQGAAGRTTILALDAGKVIYLHALVLSMDAAGTAKVCYDDDGAGTNEVDLTGAFPVAATGGFVIPFTAQKDGCVRTASGKQLTLFTTAGKAFGYAVVSKE